jgi:hypothetical protein
VNSVLRHALLAVFYVPIQRLVAVTDRMSWEDMYSS